VLAFDDLHRLQDRAALELLDRLAERLPTNWTLALATRMDPPLSLARLRGRGELAEFRQPALAFQPAEVQAMRALLGDAASPDTEELLVRTEGWPAGLRLCLSTAPQSPGPAGRGDVQRYLFDNLAAEVFGTLPEELQRFLLRVSVLSDLRASRCAAVVQEPRAVQLLEEIERRGLFASLIDVGDELTLWLHDLFREFLEDRRRRHHPEELPLLLARAAEVEDDLRRRVLLWLRAGRGAAAEAALLQAAPRLLASGGATAVLNLLEQFPPAQRDRSPSLAYVRGLAAWLRFEWGAMQRALSRAGEGCADAGQAALAQQAGVLGTVALTAPNRLDEAAQRLAQARRDPMDRAMQALCELMAYWHSGAGGEPQAPAQHLSRMVLLQGGRLAAAPWPARADAALLELVRGLLPWQPAETRRRAGPMRLPQPRRA
jgi:LuxR family maltose regulon positive regulatory protein